MHVYKCIIYIHAFVSHATCVCRVLYNSFKLNEDGWPPFILALTDPAVRRYSTYSQSVCRLSYRVWRQASISGAVIYYGSLETPVHKYTRELFPLTETEASQLAPSKGAYMPNTPFSSSHKMLHSSSLTCVNTCLQFRLKSEMEWCLMTVLIHWNRGHVQQRFKQIGHLINVEPCNNLRSRYECPLIHRNEFSMTL